MRVIHFVSGGFSGSTNVAKSIILATNQSEDIQSTLVLRKKSSTSASKIAQIRAQGIQTEVVSGAFHLLTVFQLYRVCRRQKPDILVVHGFSEHLWGRYAGLLAKVPHMIHVEHNSRERYTRFRLKQAKWLSQFTDAIVGCSEGVKQSLLKLGFAPEKTMAINNGINTHVFQSASGTDFNQRKPELLMAARFARQKDQSTLIHAVNLLKTQGRLVKLRFAGLGNKRHLAKAQALVDSLQLQEQIEFLGHCQNLPTLLAETQLFVLSTHYEGMPLALIEAMAAGCAVIGSRVVGVQEMIEHKVDGYLVEPQSPQALADAIMYLLDNPRVTENLAHRGQNKALTEFSIENMAGAYMSLFRGLVENTNSPR
ncbi:MAG: glycosyltransferase family 4 protein [Paraglaciecola sp.]|nr:glycosyltransferase family 4 protein [Paraglaciecola sp.]NCT46686.1 glycosyltransferase family 4 protein [Paraglaciecola sp.]